MSDLSPELEPEHKPRRKRKTKAEKEAERAAEIAELNKPIDPIIWILLGAPLLLVAACVYFDPIGFSNALQPSDQNWIFVILTFAVGIFGKNPTTLILTVIGLLSLGWGTIGWLRKRFGGGNERRSGS